MELIGVEANDLEFSAPPSCAPLVRSLMVFDSYLCKAALFLSLALDIADSSAVLSTKQTRGSVPLRSGLHCPNCMACLCRLATCMMRASDDYTITQPQSSQNESGAIRALVSEIRKEETRVHIDIGESVEVSCVTAPWRYSILLTCVCQACNLGGLPADLQPDSLPTDKLATAIAKAKKGGIVKPFPLVSLLDFLPPWSDEVRGAPPAPESTAAHDTGNQHEIPTHSVRMPLRSHVFGLAFLLRDSGR